MSDRQWAQWHADNPWFFAAFAEATEKLVRRGFEHYSADAVLHHIRYETALRTGVKLKVNNNCSAFYSRLYAKKYPGRRDFFRRRASQFDRAA